MGVHDASQSSWHGHGEAVEMVDHPSAAASTSTDAGLQKEVFTNTVTIDDGGLEDQSEGLDATKSTRGDAVGMKRMGKEQQLVRRFRQMSMTSFVAIATAGWEFCLFLLTPGLVDGGISGLMWNTLWNAVFFGPVYLSMAEMASMAPIAGAQYHWVSEFAPESTQKILSYLTGWTSTIAWQAGNAQGILLVGTMIQTVILIANENYAFPAWQGTLLSIAAVCIAYAANTYGARILPYWQNAMFAVHVFGFFGYIIPVWVNAPTVSHTVVWGEFQNNGGWSSVGLAVLIGQLSGMSSQVGVDTAAHMSEEVREAALSVPKTMITIYLLNCVFIFVTTLTVCYHLTDLTAALNDSTEYPSVWVLRQAMSNTWIIVILAIICLLVTASNIVYLAAVSRDLFAFSRDQGFPFSNWLSKIHPKSRIPLNASIFSCILSSILALIYIGSPVAFYAITSLCTVALLQCYCLSIGCVLWRRVFKPETLPPARWSLGRWGVPINALAVVYAAWCFFWAFWPQSLPLTAGGFNWASPIFVAVLIFAMVYYVIVARHRYEGPVAMVEGRDIKR